MNYQIDLNAIVIPGISAGGFLIGINQNEIDNNNLDQFELEQIKDYYLPEYPPINKYITNQISLDFVENKLTQIWLFKGYKGKLECGLGLGNCIGDFEKIYGKAVELYENHFEFSNLKGLFFTIEATNYKSFIKQEVISDLLLEELCVYKQR